MRYKFQLENTNKLDSQIHKSLFFQWLKAFKNGVDSIVTMMEDKVRALYDKLQYDCTVDFQKLSISLQRAKRA